MRLNRLFALSIALLAGCGDSSESLTTERGTLVSAELIGTYRPALVQQVLDLANVRVSFVPQYDVKGYRVIYITTDAKGELVEASGALFIPILTEALPMISLQHGTESGRTAVASVVPIRYGPDAILAASAGYAACSPDYLGLGVSQGIHPYLHAQSYADAVMDFIRAARTFCAREGVALNGRLFLAGYSEGAYATMAAQRAMEAESASEFPVTAVACLSGIYDLESNANTVFADPSYSQVAFFAYTLVAYDSVYGWNDLADMFLDPYAEEMPELYDGTHSFEDIEDALPSTVNELIDPGFRATYVAGTATDLLNAIRENTLLGWRPVAPIRLYHGTADRLVPFDTAVSTQSSLSSQPGTSVELHPVQGASHTYAITESLGPVFQWFDSLRR